MAGSFLAPQWPILVPYCGMDIRKSHFSLIFGTFSVGGCWGQPKLFFQNCLMKLKCPNLKPLDTIIQENYQSFYPSKPFRITRFKMRHPVLWEGHNIWRKKIFDRIMKITLNFSTFSVGGCWGQSMLLFWKLVDKTQMPHTQEYTDTFIIT